MKQSGSTRCNWRGGKVGANVMVVRRLGACGLRGFHRIVYSEAREICLAT